jgi:AcrR family transcriptional regulator
LKANVVLQSYGSDMSQRDERSREDRDAVRERRDARLERGDEVEVALPDPPWWTSEQRRSARSALSRGAIVDAALRVLDERGLDGLSMRRVADELGTGPASLYWHVANKDQLINVILDRVIGEIPLPQPDPERWEEQLRAFARDGREVFRRYRDLGRASLGRVPMGPSLLRAVEWQLQLLDGAGIPARPAAWFGDLLALYVGAHAFEDTLGTDEDDIGRAIGGYLASLPPERFPHLLAAGSELASGDADQRFEFGLDLLIRGLASVAADGRSAS